MLRRTLRVVAAPAPPKPPPPLSEQIARTRKAITHLVDRTDKLGQRLDAHDKALGRSDTALKTANLARSDVDAAAADIARLQGSVTALRDRVEALETAAASGDALPVAAGRGETTTSSNATATPGSDAASLASLVERMEALEAAFVAAPRVTLSDERKAPSGAGTQGREAKRGWVANKDELRQAGAVADVDCDGSVALSTTRVVVSGFPSGLRLPQLRVRLEGAGPVVSLLVRRTGSTGGATSRRSLKDKSLQGALQEVALVTYADANAAVRAIENLNGL
eukprot:CAMPEP_0174861804 /NCGR_PEP_ID=MMETSP1114-20130205/52476_1 /TAXON_ID=312471 /ORGANISM="Neobodo designis, Strain CCAP 1951/1" /LENGTH=279 /DNA_ID=CAMNT_0016096827 /DNA_START=36 /DNA_END=871 /DNA_ORIENTATION=+